MWNSSHLPRQESPTMLRPLESSQGIPSVIAHLPLILYNCFLFGRRLAHGSSAYGVLLGRRLLLRVEVGGRHRQFQIELPCKQASVEVGTARRLIDQTQRALLLEQQQDVAVDSDGWPRTRVRQNLLPCSKNQCSVWKFLCIEISRAMQFEGCLGKKTEAGWLKQP